MKQAVIFGAGNIGRGFIGALLSQAGYHVTFIDVAASLVESLNRAGRYPVRIVSSEGHEDQLICHVSAIDARDSAAVAEAVAGADLAATAVGAHNLGRIAPALAAGLARRLAAGDTPLNILICENLMHADQVLARHLKAELDPADHPAFDRQVGLVETSIGRMVPIQTPAMQDGDPLRVCVERYGFLPVDQAAFKGEIPPIPRLVPFAPFAYYIKRKLYLHNMAHAICAYLGAYASLATISEAIDQAEILAIVQRAMLSSARALARAYQMPLEPLLEHGDDLLRRFGNAALKDTCERVGADPKRKLMPEDRLVGAALFCQQAGVSPVWIAVGIAGALYRLIGEQNQPQSAELARQALSDIAQLPAGDPLAETAIRFYQLLAAGRPLGELRRLAAQLQADSAPDVV
ncbi:MAG: mannitol dehydrogenase [Clostridiaceae bacterium]|nr:mannitol dehydrogenase [Clostridiaceae bacterium]